MKCQVCGNDDRSKDRGGDPESQVDIVDITINGIARFHTDRLCRRCRRPAIEAYRNALQPKGLAALG